MRDEQEHQLRKRQGGTHPSRHETQSSKASSNTKCSLATELDGDQTEWLVARRDERKVGSAEDVRGEGSELRLREHAVGVHLHKAGKFVGGEDSVKIDDGADGDELHLRLLLESVYLKQHQSKSSAEDARSTYSAGMTSAMRSTPFCLDQRPTKTNRSAWDLA